jgi:hypothetical protein
MSGEITSLMNMFSDETKSLTVEEYKSRLYKLYTILDKPEFNKNESFYSVKDKLESAEPMQSLGIDELRFAELNLKLEILDRLSNTIAVLSRLHSKLQMLGQVGFQLESTIVASAVTFTIGYKHTPERNRAKAKYTTMQQANREANNSVAKCRELNYELITDYLESLRNKDKDKNKNKILPDRILIHDFSGAVSFTDKQTDYLVYWSPYEYARACDNVVTSIFRSRLYHAMNVIEYKLFKHLTQDRYSSSHSNNSSEYDNYDDYDEYDDYDDTDTDIDEPDFTTESNRQVIYKWFTEIGIQLQSEYQTNIKVTTLGMSNAAWVYNHSHIEAVLKLKALIELLQNSNFQELIYNQALDAYNHSKSSNDTDVIDIEIYDAVIRTTDSLMDKCVDSKSKFYFSLVTGSTNVPKSNEEKYNWYNTLLNLNIIDSFTYSNNSYDLKVSQKSLEIIKDNNEPIRYKA